MISISISTNTYCHTVEPILRGHPDERPTPLEMPLDTVNLNINVLISTPDERPPLLRGHFSSAKGVASQEGFHCIIITQNLIEILLKHNFLPIVQFFLEF